MSRKYLDLFKREKDYSSTDASKTLHVFSIGSTSDSAILDEWALVVRRQYKSDRDIDRRSSDIGITREDFIKDHVLPNPNKPGFESQISAGEFGELITADILEKEYLYKVPRYKLLDKPSPGSPIQNVDVIGYKFDKSSETKDEICFAEVKTSMNGSAEKSIKDSTSEVENKLSDNLRNSTSILFIMDKASQINDNTTYQELKRFMNKSETDFLVSKFAVSVINTSSYPDDTTAGYVCFKPEAHKTFIYVYGEHLKEFWKYIYSKYL